MSDRKLAEIVGENISERRRKIGLSQKELADRLGISQDAMTRMEKGKIAPKMSRLDDIAKNLHCSVGYLFRRHGEGTEELCATITEVLVTLPLEGQEALLELVTNVARVMKMNFKNFESKGCQ